MSVLRHVASRRATAASCPPCPTRSGAVVDAIASSVIGRSFRWQLGATIDTDIGDGIGMATGPLLVAPQTRDPPLVPVAAL